MTKKQLELKQWRAANRARTNAAQREWRKHNPLSLKEKLALTLRNRLNKAIRIESKSGSAVSDLGCSIEQFKIYLELKFQPGMNWDNRGIKGWHIDHIKPLSSFDLTNPEEFKKACHYTNLQPMWWQDNLAKGGK